MRFERNKLFFISRKRRPATNRAERSLSTALAAVVRTTGSTYTLIAELCKVKVNDLFQRHENCVLHAPKADRKFRLYRFSAEWKNEQNTEIHIHEQQDREGSAATGANELDVKWRNSLSTTAQMLKVNPLFFTISFYLNSSICPALYKKGLCKRMNFK